MWKDKITVMIIPRNRGEVKEYSIPVKLLWTIGVCSICFVLVNLFLLADYFDQRVDQARLRQLTTENNTLAQRYGDLKQSVAGLKSEFGLLVAKEEVIRTIFDLPIIDPESRLLGIGGPSELELDTLSPVSSSAFEVSSVVDGLVRLAQFERERYQEVYELLSGRRDRLDHTPSIMPIIGNISRGFGNMTDPFTGFKQFHSGLDIANRIGTPIYAPASGKVLSVSLYSGLGKTILIDHGFGMATRYGHLSGYNVTVGQRVKRGDPIGRVGNTGYSTGPHLHYEVLRDGRPVNPYGFILNR